MRRNILFSFITVVLVFGVIETVFRLWDFPFYFSETADLFGLPVLDMSKARRAANATIEYDPYVYWKFKPSQDIPAGNAHATPVRINAHGFRGPEFSQTPKPNTYRVICLGDSTTFGWGVQGDEAYCTRLKKYLRHHGSPLTIETINAGVPGYSSRQGLSLLQRTVRQFSPHAIIFAFGPNDRLPAQYSDQEFLDRRTFDLGPAFTLLYQTQIYKLVRSGVLYMKHRITLGEVSFRTLLPTLKRKVSPDEFIANVAQASGIARDENAHFVFLNVDFPTMPMDSRFLAIRERAEEEGLLLPDTLTFWNTREVGRAAAEKSNADVYVDVRSLFAQALEEAFVFGDAFVENGQVITPETYLMRDDGHPNPRGHDLLARAIADDLAAHITRSRRTAP